MIELDEYCRKILIFFLLEQQEAHFNELHRLIKKNLKLKKFSKPTFNTHLKHLIEAGYVKRIPDKGQLVTYSLNLEKIGKMKEYSERVKKIAKYQSENQKEFFSLPEKRQVNLALGFLVYRKLHEIQAGIEYQLDPENFEKWFVMGFYRHPILEQVTAWIIKKCVQDERYRKKILKIIDDVLEEYENALS